MSKDLVSKKILKKYIINISVLTSTIVLIIANLYNEYIDKILQDLIAPLFSFDVNDDGEPDLKQIKRLKMIIGNAKIPIGNILYNLFILFIKIVILYFIIKQLIKKLNLK